MGTREEPQFSASKQIWNAGYFVLRASGDFQNLIAIGPFDTIPTENWATGASYGYHGELRVVAVPKGSTWSVTLSDAPVSRPPRDSDKANFGSYPDWRHSRRPGLPREAV